MVKEKNSGEKAIKEKDIDKHLTDLIKNDGILNPSHTIKFLCKIIFNLRYDLNELKVELVKALGAGEGVEPEDFEELKYPNKSDWNVPQRFQYDIYS